MGTTQITEQRTNSGDIKTLEGKIVAENAEKVTVNEVQPWVILLLILGWLLPSPAEIARWIMSPFKRKKNG